MESFSEDSDAHSFRETFFMKDRIRDQKDFTTDYDYCLVLPVCAEGCVTRHGEKVAGLTAEGLECIQHLTSVGVDYVTFYGARKEQIFVLMRASVQQLRAYAEYTEYNLPLSSEKLRVLIEEGDPENEIQPMHISHIATETSLYPYQHIFGPYRSDVTEEIYATKNGMSHPFCAPVRLRLTQSMIETISLTERHSRTQTNRDSLKPHERANDLKSLKEKLLQNPSHESVEFSIFDDEDSADTMLTFSQHLLQGNMLAFFPLHNTKELEQLRNRCEKWSVMPWQLPNNKIAQYFGEKIALYFDFIGHYSQWLMIPAVVGIPIQFVMLTSHSFATMGQVVYAAFILMWGIVMLEAWKRKEAMIALKRGMSQYDENEADRPEFKGVMSTSHINGQIFMYYPSSYRKKKIVVSFTLIGTIIALVVGTIIGIYIMRAALSESLGSLAQILASVASSAQIQILNRVYPNLADRLTEFENHRTDTDFSDSMTTKLFVFLFVNSYGSFFYIAFVASQVGDGDCGGATCMPALALNLAVIFGIRELSAIMQEAIIPWLRWQRKLDKVNQFDDKDESARQVLSRAELQFISPAYDVMKDSIGEYAEIAVQYGYIMLFAAALPVAPLVGLVASCVEAKADLFKFLHIFQRPALRSTEKIGAWQDILTILSTLAVVTNAGIIVFTMNIFDDETDHTRFWIFILFQWVLLGFQLSLAILIPDVPAEVSIQQARQKVLVERAIYKIPDYCAANENNRNPTTYVKDYSIYNAVEREGCIRIARKDGRANDIVETIEAHDVLEANSDIILTADEQVSRFGSIPQHSLHAKLERSNAFKRDKKILARSRSFGLVKRSSSHTFGESDGEEQPRAHMGLRKMQGARGKKLTLSPQSSFTSEANNDDNSDSTS